MDIIGHGCYRKFHDQCSGADAEALCKHQHTNTQQETHLYRPAMGNAAVGLRPEAVKLLAPRLDAKVASVAAAEHARLPSGRLPTL